MGEHAGIRIAVFIFQFSLQCPQWSHNYRLHWKRHLHLISLIFSLHKWGKELWKWNDLSWIVQRLHDKPRLVSGHVWTKTILKFKVRRQSPGRRLQWGAPKPQGPSNVLVPRSTYNIRILWAIISKICLNHFSIMSENLWRWCLRFCFWSALSDF